MAEILPDSRELRLRTGGKFINGVWWIPFYCANCGKPAGYCPEENMTFMFYLCDYCYEAHGAIAGTMVLPDEAFWARVHGTQINMPEGG